MANSSRDEPGTAPRPDRWYDLMLGPTFDHDYSNKYCTLRYVSKPASIDKSKSGILHKNKDGRVSVEFQNNQPGKPKVSFEGSSEHYKDNDAVLFFDGETFRLERLHTAVKQLRHLRVPGESAAASASAAVQHVPTTDPRLSPVGKGAKPVHMPRSTFPSVPVEVERIDIAEPPNTGLRAATTGAAIQSTDRRGGSSPSQGTRSHEGEENQEIDIEDLFGTASPDAADGPEEDVGIRVDDNDQRQNYYDDEIADVDDSGDEENKGQNAADALRAQLNVSKTESGQHTSSSSSSSGSDSGSGSRSSSGDSEGSDDDSVNSI
ncbi:hypothetical protein MLD38_007552 [Melastoma candidum]|uniref:Uncharacterized protein n=1 Tax=Melastoma candidum TaxID=119954 RepID=A0ACB9RVS0_9MYRT|nr:hypothetical protein MLD38_007552 [Melastoma candidum]